MRQTDRTGAIHHLLTSWRNYQHLTQISLIWGMCLPYQEEYAAIVTLHGELPYETGTPPI
jgi:hypothetical protein